MLPAFEAKEAGGERYRTWDARQHHHLVVAFADENGPLLDALTGLAGEIRANNGEMVVVCGNAACPNLPEGVPMVCDCDGAIGAKYRHLVPEWNPPVVFVADRYGEIMATTDGTDPDLANHVVGWLFSAEVQCSL
jgi:hypothetical protein